MYLGVLYEFIVSMKLFFVKKKDVCNQEARESRATSIPISGMAYQAIAGVKSVLPRTHLFHLLHRPRH